jgi:hypothetical protein
MFGLLSGKSVREDAQKLMRKIELCQLKYLKLSAEDFTRAIEADLPEESRQLPERPGFADIVFPDLHNFHFQLRSEPELGGRMDVSGRAQYTGLSIVEAEGELLCSVGDLAISRATKDARKLHKILTQELGMTDLNPRMRRLGYSEYR